MWKLSKISALIIFLSNVFFSCTENRRDTTINSDIRQEGQLKDSSQIWPRGEKGSESFFTGNAFNYALLPPDSTYSTIAGNVYFEAGARTNWHTHPAGQILIILDGKGYHQTEGKPLEVLHKGDVVKCPPNVRHWHGASSDSALYQMYIVPNIEKGIVKWMEPVTDEIYNSTK